jgi:hypothetical protein
MPVLTRRRNDGPQATWQVYYGDVRIGSIALRSGNPADTDPWGWSCGFYAGSHPREHQSGTAATFEGADRFRGRMARVPVEPHRGRFSGVAPATRLDRGKYRRFDRGERMPHDWRASG